MEHWVERGDVRVDPAIAAWFERGAAPAAGLPVQALWAGLSALTGAHAPTAAALIAARAERLARIDAWYASHAGPLGEADRETWRAHLAEIGWLLPETDPAAIAVDPGPLDPELVAPHRQIVVPLTAPGACIDAVAARWARLPQSDVLAHLDRTLPLAGATWRNVTGLEAGRDFKALIQGQARALSDPRAYLGQTDSGAALFSVRGVRLRLEARDGAGGAAALQLFLEQATTARLELEGDAVLTDPESRAEAWSTLARAMRLPDTVEGVTAVDGARHIVRHRAVVLAGAAGLCDTMALAEDARGRLVPPCVLDLLAAGLALKANRSAPDGTRNSSVGRLVVCLPELDGPEELRFAAEVVDAVERICLLPPRSLALGLTAMRRRVEVNLGRALTAAPGRFALLGVGGGAAVADALRLTREAGPMPAPEALATAPWAEATERNRRAIAHIAGLPGRATLIGCGPGETTQVRTPGEARRIALQLQDRMPGVPAPSAAAQAPTALAPTALAPTALAPTALAPTALAANAASLSDRRSGRASRDPIPQQSAMLVYAPERGPAPQSALAAAARRLLCHTAAWVDDGTGRIHLTRADGADEVLCPARARAEALWLVGQLRHGRLDGETLLRLLRAEASAIDAAARADGRTPPFGDDCASHAFQAACDLVFREGDWPVGDALAVLRARRVEALTAR